LLLPAHSWHAPSSMRTAPSLLRLVSILLDLAQDVLQFLLLGTRSSAALKAENIFLRKQLALYLEREARAKLCGHRVPIDQQVVAKAILGGLHHEYRLERIAA
jgi:hypothetical protein